MVDQICLLGKLHRKLPEITAQKLTNHHFEYVKPTEAQLNKELKIHTDLKILSLVNVGRLVPATARLGQD